MLYGTAEPQNHTVLDNDNILKCFLTKTGNTVKLYVKYSAIPDIPIGFPQRRLRTAIGLPSGYYNPSILKNNISFWYVPYLGNNTQGYCQIIGSQSGVIEFFANTSYGNFVAPITIYKQIITWTI